MKNSRGIRAGWMSLAATALSVVLSVGVGGGQPALAYYQIVLRMQSGYQWTIDVETNFTIDEVKLRVQDRMGIFPPDVCLVYVNKFLEPSRQLSDYNIQAGSVIEVFAVPVVPGWSSTPDEPVLGSPVSNFVKTLPTGTHYEVVDGVLPAGVTLDADTGVLTGAFTELGDFSATIRATTVCGDGDVTWAGTVAALNPQTEDPSVESSALPDTGTNVNFDNPLALGSAITVLIGFLLLLRRRQAS